MDYSNVHLPNTLWVEDNCSECNAINSLRIAQFYNKKEQRWDNDFVVCLHCGKKSCCN